MYYEINETQARQSKAMWSMSDYKEGSATAEYKQMVDRAYSMVNALPEEAQEKGTYYADKYAKKLADNINKGFNIELRCPSILISGRGNFPVAKKEKQNAARDKNMLEYKEIQKYLDKIQSVGMGSAIIKSGDADVITQLQEKVSTLEAKQVEMKAANAYWRKNKTMAGFDGITQAQAAKLDKDIMDSWHQAPYMPASLTNNNAKIKAAKVRLAKIKKAKETGDTEETNQYFKIVENTEIMRLQLIFEGKPEADARNILKKNGFKWAPSQNAWQRQLTGNARYAAKRIVEELEKM